MRGTIVPMMKIYIKRFANEHPKLVNGKANIFARDKETKVIVALIFHLEIPLVATKTRMKIQSNKILIELEEISSESSKEEETILSSVAMDSQPSRFVKTILKMDSNLKIQKVTGQCHFRPKQIIQSGAKEITREIATKARISREETRPLENRRKKPKKRQRE
jgi:hypothetical protein